MDDTELRSRLRRDLRDEVTQHPSPRRPKPQPLPVTVKPPSSPKSRHSKRNLWAIPVVALLIIGAAAGFGQHRHHANVSAPVSTSAVPKAVSQAVNFPVYYPDPKKLPAGYSLDLNSFSSPVKNGVSYSVNYDTNKKIVFSVQAKPSDSELQTFNSSYIPLRSDYLTPVGQAEIGAYHNQTLVSLPIVNGPWIVITAPPDINQDQLKAVLSLLKH